MAKGHILSKNKIFAISPMLQTLMCLLGQCMVYAEASEVFLKTLHLDVNAMQIQRVCEYYGKVIDKGIERNIELVIPKLKQTQNEEHTYVMVDGSMLYTRDEQWKETKLARIFNETSKVSISEKRNEILNSVYVSHMGSINEFFPKLERYLVEYKKKVFIADGAKWIWNWVEDNYPNAVQILDFYHASEKIELLGKTAITSDEKRKEWVKHQKELLLNNGVEQVMDNAKCLKPRSEEGKKAKEKLISYYLEHEDRMLYKTYQDKGLLIGSGPIEAAHRSVLQSRMKRSGQKWSVDGANAMANLRCYKKSNAWNIIEKLIIAA